MYPPNHLKWNQLVLKPMTWRSPILGNPKIGAIDNIAPRMADRLCRATTASPSWTARWVSLYAACQPPGQLVRRYSGSSFQTPCLCAGRPCNLFEVTNTSFFLLTCCHCTQNSIISWQSQLAVTCCDSKIKKILFSHKMDQVSYTTKYKIL